LYRTRHKPSTTALTSRCRRHQPRVANRFWRRFHQLWPRSLILVKGMPGFPEHDPCGRCQPLHGPSATRPLTYLSPPDPSPVSRLRFERLEPFPHAVHQHHGFPGSGNAFHPLILRNSLVAGAQSDPSRQPSVPELCHPGLRFDTRSHAVSAC
jgi:hypothetical protein